MKTISTTYCRRFDNSCYRHQCIANCAICRCLQYVVGIVFIGRDFQYVSFVAVTDKHKQIVMVFDATGD